MKIRTHQLLMLLLFVILATNHAWSVIAYPNPVNFKQPDGTTVTVMIKGDEFLNWKETLDGYTLLHNSNGVLEYAVLDSNNNLTPSGIKVSDIEKRNKTEKDLLAKTNKKLLFSKEQIAIGKQLRKLRDTEIEKMRKAPGSTGSTDITKAQKAFPTQGSRKLICILMGFKDLAFTLTQTDFNNLFNQLNYSVDLATGSVRDFYLENSYGQLDLSVDVAGPYTAANNMAYYGNNVNGNEQALASEAVTKADPDVDYNTYDNDDDGEVDGVYIIFAGYGEEAGGPADAIWSHASSINYTANETTGTVVIRSYSCSPELRGNSGTNITRIGVICHEFGHTLGAPDFYDVDYEVNGEYDGTGNWDMMASGSWNNNGTTPAHHNGWTKVIYYNWANVITLNSPAQITLLNAAENKTSFYKFNTTTEGEYYFLENREKHKFDSYIPGSGMLIYHIHSGVFDVGNEINATHPQRMYPVASNATVDPVSGNYGTINTADCAWTGLNKTSFTDNSLPSAKSWSGGNSMKPITDIIRNTTEKTVSFSFMGGNSCSPPTIQATGFSTSNILENEVTLHWTRGNGNRVIVLARRNAAVNTSPLNGTSFTADSRFGKGDLIDAGTYVVYDGSGTTVTVTDLLKNSTYYFAIFEYNTADSCYLSPPLTGSAATPGCAPCIPTDPKADYGFGISQVQINTIINPSAPAKGYADYTDRITELTAGNSYDLKVTVYSYNNEFHTNAWIDWNNNCIFETGEVYTFGSSDQETILTKSIAVPADAFTGFVTLRVRTRFSTAPTACDANDYSEAEDYTLKIIGRCTPPTVQATNVSATDMQSGQLTLNWKRGNGTRIVVVAREGSAVDITSNQLKAFTADARFGTGTQFGSGNYVVYDGENNRVTVTALRPGTSYHFALWEYFIADSCFIRNALTANFTTNSGCSACTPDDTSSKPDMAITNVLINTINNTTGRTGAYGDYKNLRTNVLKGQSYDLSVAVNDNKSITKVWIDWNKNCLFDDTGEEYTYSTTPLIIAVPAAATSGPTTMRIRTKSYKNIGQAVAPTACGAQDDSEAEDYTLVVTNPVTVWNGSQWSISPVTQLYDAMVEGDYEGAGFTCNNLTVKPGKHLTIASGTLTVNGILKLESDLANGTATLLNNGTLSVGIKTEVEQYLATSRNWYVSSPVSNAKVPLGYTCYLYREPGDNSTFTPPASLYWKSVVAGETFTPGAGYIALPESAGLSIIFSTETGGNLNDGDKIIPLSYNSGSAKPGFNLIGNPYPSYLNVMPAINANTSVSTTIWYRTRSVDAAPAYYFETVNTTSGVGTDNASTGTVTGYIPPAQGFWVKVNAPTSLTFNNSYRYHSTINNVITTPLKSPEAGNTVNQLLRLKVSNGTYTDEAIIYFNSKASNGYDIYDSEKMTNGNKNIPEIYTMAGNKELVINGMNSYNSYLEIPLGFRTGNAGDFTVYATEIRNFDEGVSVYLRNNMTGESLLISDKSIIEFNSTATENDGMFSVIFRQNNIISDLEKLSTFVWQTNSNDSRQIIINFNKPLPVPAEVRISNMVGQQLFNKKLTKQSTVFDVPESGVYLVTIDNITQKVIVK